MQFRPRYRHMRPIRHLLLFEVVSMTSFHFPILPRLGTKIVRRRMEAEVEFRREMWDPFRALEASEGFRLRM